MSFIVFQRQMVEVVNDLGNPFWKPVAEEANALLREVLEIRQGKQIDHYLHWTLAEKQDFVAAAEKLKAAFSDTTGERVTALARLHDAQVSLRPTAVWLDGKTYRVRLARLWSYSPGDRKDIRWAAEITPFGRVCAGGYRGFMTGPERKKFQIDAPSEYLAEKGMREIFEKTFRVTLLS